MLTLSLILAALPQSITLKFNLIGINIAAAVSAIINIAKKPIWANICCFALFYYAFGLIGCFIFDIIVFFRFRVLDFA